LYKLRTICIQSVHITYCHRVIPIRRFARDAAFSVRRAESESPFPRPFKTAHCCRLLPAASADVHAHAPVGVSMTSSAALCDPSSTLVRYPPPRSIPKRRTPSSTRKQIERRQCVSNRSRAQRRKLNRRRRQATVEPAAPAKRPPPGGPRQGDWRRVGTRLAKLVPESRSRLPPSARARRGINCSTTAEACAALGIAPALPPTTDRLRRLARSHQRGKEFNFISSKDLA
jgi:hypothetical protein